MCPWVSWKALYKSELLWSLLSVGVSVTGCWCVWWTDDQGVPRLSPRVISLWPSGAGDAGDGWMNYYQIFIQSIVSYNMCDVFRCCNSLWFLLQLQHCKCVNSLKGTDESLLPGWMRRTSPSCLATLSFQVFVLFAARSSFLDTSCTNQTNMKKSGVFVGTETVSISL